MVNLAKFDDILDAATSRACRSDPELSRVGEGHMVEIPQRAFRQPGRPWYGSDRLEPVLTRMVAVGRGGADIRVRLYLWMWAIASTRSSMAHSIRRSTGEWAVLLNALPGKYTGHETKRAQASRRVLRAQDWLVKNGAVGRPRQSELVLLDPDCSNSAYEPWSESTRMQRQIRRSELESSWGHAYDQRRAGDWWEDDPLRVPLSLWSNGTISALSGRALVTLLTLLDYERRFEATGQPILPPKSRPYEYPLSRSVWTVGLHELRDLGCIHHQAGPEIFGDRGAKSADGPRYRAAWHIDHRRLEARHRDRWSLPRGDLPQG